MLSEGPLKIKLWVFYQRNTPSVNNKERREGKKANDSKEEEGGGDRCLNKHQQDLRRQLYSRGGRTRREHGRGGDETEGKEVREMVVEEEEEKENGDK